MALPQVSELTSGFLRPDPPPAAERVTNLSITDSAAAIVPPTGAVWYYDYSSAAVNALSFDTFTVSLQKTLAYYPHFAGSLHWIPFSANGDHAQRQGRLSVRYGTPDDAGVQIITARCSTTLASVVPNAAQRGNCWSTDSVPGILFIPMDKPLALNDGRDTLSGPNVMVKLTKFSCGSIALAIRTVHVFTDGHTLFRFMRDWASMHRALATSRPLPILAPEFAPSLLDFKAAGDINAAEPDDQLLQSSRALPIHRYDWSVSSEGAPAFMRAFAEIPSELNTTQLSPPGPAMPWTEWDWTQPTSHYRLRFSATEVQKMHAAALASAPPVNNSSSNAATISRLDALLAHLWQLTNRARALHGDNSPVYLNYAFNMRGRLGLSDNFIGNPMILAQASVNRAADTTGGSIGTMAAAIRASVAALDGPALATFLHDAAHQVWLQRYCQWFLGRHHLVTTSWVHQAAHRINFGAGLARYLEVKVPDYFVVVLEGPNGVKGYDDGVEVVINIESATMERILKDPLLRAYSVAEKDEAQVKEKRMLLQVVPKRKQERKRFLLLRRGLRHLSTWFSFE